MARGWESKSIESQQDDAATRSPELAPVSAEEASRRAQRATLSLARNHALAELQQACRPPHRAMLEQAIAELDSRLAELDRQALRRE
jgi:hypothetical protein